MATVGNLRHLRGDMVTFEWKIKDFLQLSDKADTCYESPEFSFCGATWVIQIYPNGQTHNKSVGFINVYIGLKSLAVPVSVNCSLYLETVYKDADFDANIIFTRDFPENHGYGLPELISRSELIEKESELLPSGVLTVICTLKKIGPSDEDAGYATVDEFTQTEEGTGVFKLQQHFKEILENENVSDVVLRLEGQEFKSHRCVLAARSPVFLAMMTHDTKEKKTGVVDIQDIEPVTFSDFLRYLYTGSEHIITQENVVKLYTAADKYQVDELKNSCLDYMLSNISVDNFYNVLSLSLEHVEKDLIEACSQFYIENTEAVISNPMWITFLKTNPVASNELQLKHLKYIKNKN